MKKLLVVTLNILLFFSSIHPVKKEKKGADSQIKNYSCNIEQTAGLLFLGGMVTILALNVSKIAIAKEQREFEIAARKQSEERSIEGNCPVIYDLYLNDGCKNLALYSIACNLQKKNSQENKRKLYDFSSKPKHQANNNTCPIKYYNKSKHKKNF